MNQHHMEAKEKLLQATLEILDEGVDPDKITTRDIAKRAGVNSALVNYHFQSKDNLIEQAIGVKMIGIADQMYDPKNSHDSPVEKLKRMMKKNAELAIRYHFLMKKAISFELKNGSYATVQTILPVVKEIFQGQKTEQELQLIALQCLVPLQTMFVHREIYQKIWGWDLSCIENVYHVIDVYIENLLPKQNSIKEE